MIGLIAIFASLVAKGIQICLPTLEVNYLTGHNISLNNTQISTLHRLHDIEFLYERIFAYANTHTKNLYYFYC